MRFVLGCAFCGSRRHACLLLDACLAWGSPGNELAAGWMRALPLTQRADCPGTACVYVPPPKRLLPHHRAPSQLSLCRALPALSRKTLERYTGWACVHPPALGASLSNTFVVCWGRPACVPSRGVGSGPEERGAPTAHRPLPVASQSNAQMLGGERIEGRGERNCRREGNSNRRGEQASREQIAAGQSTGSAARPWEQAVAGGAGALPTTLPPLWGSARAAKTRGWKKRKGGDA